MIAKHKKKKALQRAEALPVRKDLQNGDTLLEESKRLLLDSATALNFMELDDVNTKEDLEKVKVQIAKAKTVLGFLNASRALLSTKIQMVDFQELGSKVNAIKKHSRRMK